MPRAKEKKENISQRARFIEAARELGCNEGEPHFKTKLGEIARAKVPPSKRKKPKRQQKNSQTS